ncbi:BrnT family toxin [Patescibacteria group bacterium]|nr:BrnT family toxin [Patescibacteria group bacterium]MBU1931085.1 BrnT family toxin [Patescibacteria group bacterium]
MPAKIKPIKFDWDKDNKYKNWEKHKVDFKECEEIFFNKPLKTLYDTKHSQKENRFIAFGKTNKNKKLYIVFTIRSNKIRIISARKQSQKERKYYEKS